MARPVSGFASFYEETAPAVFRFAYVVAGEAGEDLAAEAYARALARWSEVSGYDRPDAWVRRVLLNLVVSRARRERAKRAFLASRAGWAGTVTDEGSEDRIVLRRALAELSPRQRAVVILRFGEDLPLNEIARSLGCSVSSVNAHLKRALPKLRAALGDVGPARVEARGEEKQQPPPSHQRPLGTRPR